MSYAEYHARHASDYVREDVVGMYYLKCRHPELCDQPETFPTWRSRALTHAAACRDLWRETVAMTDEELKTAIKVKEYQLSEPVRSLRNPPVDLWYLRMYRNEKRRRAFAKLADGERLRVGAALRRLRNEQ